MTRMCMSLGALIVLALPMAVAADSPAEREFRSIIQLQTNPSHGQALFDTCAACHGPTGAGVSDGTVPAIAGQHFRVIVAALVGFRHASRRDPRMQHFTDQHHLATAQDIADVARYASQLTPTQTSAHGDGTNNARGAALYQSACASCHGVKAEGNDRGRYPRLAGQHYSYLMSQLGDSRDGRRPVLAAAHDRLLAGLQGTDLIGLCDYLSRLGP